MPRSFAILRRAALSLVLGGLALWMIAYGWPQRVLYYQDYTFSAAEARRLAAYPEAMAAFGRRTWADLNAAAAADFLAQAVRRNPLDMESWLKLAEVEAARGHAERARSMVRFVADRTGRLRRWQWPTALLAHELGLETIFLARISYLASHRLKLADALNLLDTHFAGRTDQSLAALAPAAYPAYLEWLMRRGRTADTLRTWAVMTARKPPDEETLLKYLSFLVSKKEIAPARAIWQAQGGGTGVTNGGFERKITSQGFDWRLSRSPDETWQVQQIPGEGRDQSTAARVRFAGLANADFHHLYQIVPVTSAHPLHLTFWWRGQGLTTDQGPFIEITGYDCPGLYAAGPMLLGSRGWQAETVGFTPPADCQAVLVRLRRKPSTRFDSRIGGTVWIDDVALMPQPTP